MISSRNETTNGTARHSAWRRRWVKMMAFALSGFLASFAGGAHVLHQQALGSDIFAPIESIRVLTMVVVGGLGSVVGSVLGATFLQSTEWFSDVVPDRFRFFFESAGSGIGLIVVLMLCRVGSARCCTRHAIRGCGSSLMSLNSSCRR